MEYILEVKLKVFWGHLYLKKILAVYGHGVFYSWMNF